MWFGGGDASAIYDRLWATPALDAIRVAHEGGAVVAGVSAGAIVWGRGTLSDYASLGEREPFPLFGWLSDLVVFAHYGPARERAFRHLVASFPGCGGLAVTHGGVVVVGAGGRDLTVLREGSTGTPHLLLGGAEAPLLPVGD